MIQARLAAQAESRAAPAENPAPPVHPSAGPATTGEPTSVVSDPVPPVDPRESDPAYWKQRFTVTSGMLRTERDERTRETERFNLRIAELQDQVQTLQANAPQPELDITQFMSPEQIEQLGEDDARAVVSAAMKTAQETVRATLAAEIQPLKDRAQSDAARDLETRKRQFTDALEAAHPGFAEVDASAGWHAWLAQDNDLTGETHQALLNRLVSRADVARTAAMFKAYEKSIAPAPTPPIAPNGSGAVPQDPRPTVQAGPSGGHPTPVEKREYFKRSALGKVKDAERVAFEARLKLPPR